MATLASPAQQTERVSLSRLLWVGPLTIVVATIASFIIQQLAVAVLRPDPAFMPLTLMPPIIFTIVGVLGAVIVFALVARFARNPIPLFRRIALITLAVTFIPDILMLITGFNPGTNLANVLVLMLMHVVAWAITVGMLTRLSVAK
jgi:hypothetical protein